MSLPAPVGFVGTGKMATALATGLVRASILQPRQITGSDVSPDAVQAFSQATGAGISRDNLSLANTSRTIVLAVKPAQIQAIAQQLQPALTPEHLVISIAAGITLTQLQAWLGPDIRIIRTMPNTPALVSAGATAYSLGPKTPTSDAEAVQTLFSAVGIAVQVPESLLDAVTGLSGSGPAYGYQIIEALSDGAVAAGLPRDIATRLAAQTLLGAARMVLETGIHPGALKDMVTSPGGTTIEGLHAMEQAGVRAGLMNAVRAAADKSRQLSR
ncbi:MAG: pyrroline-5-carboxylate reductase [Limisphaerales bacterium]|jgi:pyrroline-5-carboxylate reductase